MMVAARRSIRRRNEMKMSRTTEMKEPWKSARRKRSMFRVIYSDESR